MSKSLAPKAWICAWLLTNLMALPLTAEDIPQPDADSTDTTLSIRLGAEDSWPPYSNEHGQGISTELIKAAFAKAGVTPHFQTLPYARVLHDLDSGKIDGGYNVTLQSTTKNRFLFGAVPLLSAESYWFFKPNSFTNIKRIEDIPAKFRVGIIRDYEYGDIYEQHRHRFTEIQLTQQSQIIRMLKQGRIDAAVMFDREAEFALNKMGLDKSIMDKRFLNHRGDLYLAFSHKSPRAIWLAQEFDKGLLMLKQSGEYDRIITDTK
ncbi:ABC transporter substrate-binding protein [Cellvibrio sp. KY-GH-1]|uniref:substrate-binding periplasmic protein n=1 Tax=Cellvibrio sp. KY-GH-1 TaxID=2303332 RepID=UPI001CD93915|nr:transporter substrate-binding domain-containing protein [Cellvibrio sp. KY-GH-1]